MLEIRELSQILSEDSLRNQWLCEKELHRYSSFKLDKRKNEWLGGRICAKLAAEQMLAQSVPHDYREIVVLNAPGGRPVLRVNGLDNSHRADISISHSGMYAVALVANNYCGIDIQEISETLLRVQERFCLSNDEKVLIKEFNSTITAAELNLLWSAKEAIRKALSYHKVPDFLALNLSKIKTIQKDLYELYFSYRDKTLSTICGHYRNYSLAICVQKGLADARTS